MIRTPRRTGKTTRLAALANELDGLFITLDYAEAQRVKHEHGVAKVATFTDAFSGKHEGITTGIVVIDNAEAFLAIVRATVQERNALRQQLDDIRNTLIKGQY